MTSTDLASGKSDDIDPAWLDFLNDKVNSFVKWDLIRFYHDNPHAADIAEHIARFIVRDARRVERALEELAAASVLQRQEVGDHTVYRLSDDHTMRERISRFLLACDDRQFRVKAIHHMIRSKQ